MFLNMVTHYSKLQFGFKCKHLLSFLLGHSLSFQSERRKVALAKAAVHLKKKKEEKDYQAFLI